jgi:hypothetical protein
LNWPCFVGISDAKNRKLVNIRFWLTTSVAVCIINLDINSVEPQAFAANSFELAGAALSPTALVITQPPLQLEILNQPE